MPTFTDLVASAHFLVSFSEGNHGKQEIFAWRNLVIFALAAVSVICESSKSYFPFFYFIIQAEKSLRKRCRFEILDFFASTFVFTYSSEISSYLSHRRLFQFLSEYIVY